MSARPRLLFVGAFTRSDDGLTGGTVVACTQLLQTPFSDRFEILKIDIAQRTKTARRFLPRLFSGVRRVAKALVFVVVKRPESALIFATLGPSWVERGLIALICRIGGTRAFLFPRCAEVNAQIETSRGIRTFTKFMASTGIHFLFQGQELRRRFLTAVPKAMDRTEVIGNWIDLQWCHGVAPPSIHRQVNILYVGWLHPMKGVDVLIRAIVEDSSKFSDCRFVLCGDGVERVRLENDARSSAVPIEFRGWVHGAEKLRAFSEADIVVLPSRVEGMPNVLLEAMSASRPVVATLVGSVSDLITDGVEGYLVPSEDSKALGTALHRLVRDPGLRLRMGEAGLARVAQHHDLAIVWRQIAHLLDNGSSQALPIREKE